jgi:hypothetical protein
VPTKREAHPRHIRMGSCRKYNSAILCLGVERRLEDMLGGAVIRANIIWFGEHDRSEGSR